MRIQYTNIVADIITANSEAKKRGRTIDKIFVTEDEWRELLLAIPNHHHAEMKVYGIRIVRDRTIEPEAVDRDD